MAFHNHNNAEFDPNQTRQRPRRPVTDYGSTMVQWMRYRGPPHMRHSRMEQERPSPSYIIDMVPPIGRKLYPAETIPAKHLHSSLNKIKHPVNVVKWTPEGRRLLTGSSSGEFTLWNGMGFNFETIMQAHESAIRAARWSHSGDWLLSTDHDGILKYWQPNFNNVKAIQAHEHPIRDLAFSPTDSKFVTASDDATLKVWDFSGSVEEMTLTGHGWDAKTVDWHPTKGLLVSGSKDHQVKLWDPRTGRCLTTLHGHKNQISKASFEPNRGQLLATCARDNVARVFDLRMMRDVLLLKGHDKDIMTLTWHPIHVSLLSTGGADGSLFHYILDEPNPPNDVPLTLSPYDSPEPENAPAQTIYPAHRVQFAHDQAIWSLDWHPLGHILASGSNDRVTRFWTRARPGESDCFKDRYHMGENATAEAHGWNRNKYSNRQQVRDDDEQEDDEADGLVDQNMPARQTLVPGLPGMSAIQPNGTNGGGAQTLLPGMGLGVPPPILPGGAPPIPPLLPGMDPRMPPDLSRLASLFGGQLPPPPIPNGAVVPPPPPPGQFPPPPLPGGFPGLGQPGVNFLPPPAGMSFPPPPPTPQDNANSAASTRRRAPLPDQKDALRDEMRRGNYRTAR